MDRLARGVRRGERRAPVRDGQHPVRARQAPGAARRGEPLADAAGGADTAGGDTAGDGSKRVANRVRSQVLGQRAHAARQLLKTHGPRVFFLGHGVNTARECVFNAVFFSAFEHTAHGFETEAGLSPAMATAAAGGVAGAAGWLTNLPLDCVKSGIQGQCLGDGRAGMGRGAGREGRVRRGGEGGWREGRDRRLFRRRGSVAGAFFRGEREQVHGVHRGDGGVPRRAGACGRVADGVGNRARLREPGRARRPLARKHPR